MAELSEVEGIKARSRHLRGTLLESLADAHTGALREPDTHILKFHGSYQQDDRDLREERRLQKLEPAYGFMIRTRLPGGVCTPAQWLALTDIARRHGSSGLRLTTRQAFQIHGVVKSRLKETMAAINATLIDTVAACGDVNRNVLASATPLHSALHAELHRWAERLSQHLLPSTRAYHEIWLDGAKIESTEESEPLYGDTYLPRKFKSALALPPDNDVDIFGQDLGFIAIVEGGRITGFNLTAGGGMGTSHGESETYARLADVIGFLEPDRLLDVAAAVLATQRDFGDRTNRKHARLKYTIADRGVDWFRGEVERRASVRLAPARPFEFTHHADRFGWLEDGASAHLTLRIPAGRVNDGRDVRFLTGLAEVAAIHEGHFRLTPNQNLLIADVAPLRRANIEELVRKHRLDQFSNATPLERDALACVALPTCGLAMAEAERYLPDFSSKVAALLASHGLAEQPLTLRITGCPNGCARPFLAEVALVGKAPGRYNLFLGGDGRGQRLNVLYRENIDEATILQALDSLLERYAAERGAGERFGDFLRRSQLLTS